MPSFFKQARGVQKPQHVSVHKTIFHVIEKKSKPQSYLSRFLPQNWFFASEPVIAPAIATAPAPEPCSSVFETCDCIWYYGTLYVKESAAVERLKTMQQIQEQPQHQVQEDSQQQLQEQPQQYQENQLTQPPHGTHYTNADDDDDTESVSSSNSNNHNHPRNVGKQNQLKYLSDGMRLKHLILLNRAKHEWNEWYATFDSETNRIIRTPDGVAFDTLRQFARLHCNEVLGTTATLNNVWSDPHFQYQDADGEWHPLAKLK